MSDFDAFWAAYPSKVGKLAAEQEYAKARKRASAADILKGVDAYVANKPEWKEWCNPKTFLHQGRWMDEYEPKGPTQRTEIDNDWFEECKALHDLACGERLFHYHRMLRDHAAKKEQAS